MRILDIMRRIKIPPFNELTNGELVNKISFIQSLREQSLAESRIKKGGQTKSAVKNQLKQGKKVKDPATDLAKLLQSMTKTQRDNFLAKLKGGMNV